MQFNPGDGSGIVDEIDKLCDTNATSYPLADKTRRVNSALETLISKIIQYCINFPFDDENFANIASGTITLEEGVSKYTITDKFLDILEIKVKDNNGYWNFVKPYSLAEAARDGIILETKEAETGLPQTYRAMGRTIFLAPAPTASSVILTAGLKFVSTRTGHLFASDDTIAEPGIASPWHITLAKMAALPYNKIYHPTRVPQLERDIMIEIQDMLIFYANRQKDRKSRFIPAIEDNH